jgi:hypothetical protein
MDEDGPNPVWRRALAVLLVVIGLSVAGTYLMGGQVSKILSTVGASVGTPGQGAGAGGGSGSEPDDGSPDDGPPDDGEGGDPGAADDPGEIAALQDAGRPDLLIIRQGTITIQVGDIDAALTDAGAAIASLGGYESGSARSGREEDARAEVIYRFPASSWQSALVAIRGVGEEVLDEHSQTTDVSAEVVDLEARIRNLQVTEAAFQAIMDRAAAIKDVLEVQARLSRVRSEIEQLTSKAAHLREQAAMSTLTVAFVVAPTPVVARQKASFDPGGEAEAATARLVAMLQAIAVAGIWFAIAWLPVLVAFAIVAGVTFLVIRRFRSAAPQKVAVS